jgi:predicted permease
MTVLNTVLPIFLVIGLGLGLRRTGVLDDGLVGALSKLVFFVAAPALLFRATATGTIDETFNGSAMVVVVVVSILVGTVTYLLCFRSHPDRRGVIAQGAFRSNQVFIGLPIVIYAFGEEAVQVVAVQVSLTVILYNFLGAVFLILPQQGRSARSAAVWGRTAVRVMRNPLIVASAAGILYSLTGLPVPVVADRTLALMGQTAAPLALLTVGAGLEFGRLRGDLATTAAVSLVKTVLYPSLILAGLKIAGLQGLDLKAPLMLMTAPAAVIGYVMTRELGGDVKLSGAIVIGSTLLSVVTITAWLAWVGG